MSRTITLIAAVGAAVAVAAPSALGKGQPVEPQWMQALDARSQELNRVHGLGDYSPAIQALKLRSEALNQKYGLGAYPASTVRIDEARERPVVVGAKQTSMLDAREQSFATKRNVQLSNGTTPDAFERAVRTGSTDELGAYPASTVRIMDARTHPVVAGGERTSMLDARERAFVAKRIVQLSDGGTLPDAFERAVGARGTGSLDHFNANDNRFRVTPVHDPVTVSATGTGDEIEWPQIGIGLGIGIALMLGLGLGLKATRQPPLAH
jgi:hypothetical protein